MDCDKFSIENNRQMKRQATKQSGRFRPDKLELSSEACQLKDSARPRKSGNAHRSRYVIPSTKIKMSTTNPNSGRP